MAQREEEAANQSGDSSDDSAERCRCSARGSNQPARRSSYNNCGDLPNTSACGGFQKRHTRSLILSAELSRIVRSTAEVPAFGVRRRGSWIMCGDTCSTLLTTLRISSQPDRVLISRGTDQLTSALPRRQICLSFSFWFWHQCSSVEIREGSRCGFTRHRTHSSVTLSLSGTVVTWNMN